MSKESISACCTSLNGPTTTTLQGISLRALSERCRFLLGFVPIKSMVGILLNSLGTALSFGCTGLGITVILSLKAGITAINSFLVNSEITVIFFVKTLVHEHLIV